MRDVFEIPDEDVEAIKELWAMKSKEIERVDFTPYKCYCAHEGCKRFVTLRDFGAEPFFWSRLFRWVDLSQQKFYCSNHKSSQIVPK